MKLLALDTSTEACSVALVVDHEIHARYRLAPREHAALVLPMVEELLAEASIGLAALDALAFGRGPGSFTGVRIASAIVQGLAFGADLPVVPVSTLAALAQGAYRKEGAEWVLAAIDARMGEVYWGAYHIGPSGLAAAVAPEQVIPPAQVTVPGDERWLGVGSGWASYQDTLLAHLGAKLGGWHGERYPHAHDVATLGIAGFQNGEAVTAEQALPVYLRDKVAWKKVNS